MMNAIPATAAGSGCRYHPPACHAAAEFDLPSDADEEDFDDDEEEDDDSDRLQLGLEAEWH
jgi:hypothetical protein